MSNHDREGSHPSNRDTPLERAWREASDEQPPAHLDAAIIAAARKSVAERSQTSGKAPTRPISRNWVTRWQPLAAAATVAGLAFVLVQMLPREQSIAPSKQRQESTPMATVAEPQLQSSSARETTFNSQAPSDDLAAGALDRSDVAVAAPDQAAAPAPATLPAPPAAKAEATVSDSAGLLGASSAARSKAVAPEMDSRAVAAAAAAAPSATAETRERNFSNAAPLDATAWAAKIATLHAAGDIARAEQALRDFRAAVPDADTYLPESLRSWARAVR